MYSIWCVYNDAVIGRNRASVCVSTLALLAFARPASAGSGDWGGLYDGRTLQSGGEAFVEGGFPGAGLGVLFGTSENIDLGLRVGVTYSGLGVYATDALAPALGLDPRIVARFAIVRSRVVSFLFRLEPGVRFARFDPSVRWGPEIDVGADFGIRVTPRRSNLRRIRGPPLPRYPEHDAVESVRGLVPVLVGAGFEYHATDLIGFGARFAPGVDVAVGDFAGSPKTRFAFVGAGVLHAALGQRDDGPIAQRSSNKHEHVAWASRRPCSSVRRPSEVTTRPPRWTTRPSAAIGPVSLVIGRVRWTPMCVVA